MKKGYFWRCITLLALHHYAESQCNGTFKEITGNSGEIRSPNFSTNEYNKSTNCTWSFPSLKPTEALILTIKQLRLFTVKFGQKHCLGSYNLTIKGETIDCERFVGEEFCNALFGSSSCAHSFQYKECERSSLASYPVLIEYFSDGRTSPNITFASLYFRLAYNRIECPKECSPVTSGSGEILSPNYPNEYSHQAYCLWNLSQPQDGAEYALLISVEQMLVIFQSGKPICSDSYRLNINGERSPCQIFVNVDESGIGKVCQTFYGSPSCRSMNQIRHCQEGSNSTSSVIMTYYSDGKTLVGNIGTPMFFKIHYQFIKCPQRDTTIIPETTTYPEITISETTRYSQMKTPETSGYLEASTPETTRNLETTIAQAVRNLEIRKTGTIGYPEQMSPEITIAMGSPGTITKPVSTKPGSNIVGNNPELTTASSLGKVTSESTTSHQSFKERTSVEDPPTSSSVIALSAVIVILGLVILGGIAFFARTKFRLQEGNSNPSATNVAMSEVEAASPSTCQIKTPQDDDGEHEYDAIDNQNPYELEEADMSVD